jgi:hypothetical protein
MEQIYVFLQEKLKKIHLIINDCNLEILKNEN